MSWGDDDQDYLSLVTLILVLFIMMICVFGVLIVGFFNIRKILKSSLVFYGLLGLLLVVKLIAYLAFAIKIIIIVANDPDPDQKHRILSGFETSYKNGMFVSDFVIVELFLILMKEFHALQAESLLNQVPHDRFRTQNSSRTSGRWLRFWKVLASQCLLPCSTLGSSTLHSQL